jgi:hypothetical protein
VVASLKQMPEMERTPVVMVTAWPADKALEMSERYGFDGCILKPIDVRAFAGQVAGYLERGARRAQPE